MHRDRFDRSALGPIAPSARGHGVRRVARAVFPQKPVSSGPLGRGKTLADMNDRTGRAMHDEAPELAVVERLVGALSSACQGPIAAEMVGRARELCGFARHDEPDVADRTVRRCRARAHAQAHRSVEAPPTGLDGAPVAGRDVG